MMTLSAAGVHELAQPLQRVIFALDGDDDAVRRGERVDRKQPQRGRAVDEDIVELPAHLVKGALQDLFAALLGDELHFRAREVDVRGQDGERCKLGGEQVLFAVLSLDEHLIDGLFQRALGKAEARRGVALRVDVDEQHFSSHRRKIRRHVDAPGAEGAAGAEPLPVMPKGSSGVPLSCSSI